jgi:iron complex transport system permease protein
VTGAFVSGRGGRRLTARRWLIGMLSCVAIAVVVAAVASFLGVSADRGGRHLAWLGTDAIAADAADHAIWMLRVARVLSAVIVGGALAGAGCALQALLRNPLAEPFTLGISSGSSLAAVVAIRLGIEGALGGLGIGTAAFVGAAGTLIVIARLARVGNHLPPATMLLAGVTVSMFCSAASVLIQYTSDFADQQHMLIWTIGGLDSARLGPVEYAALPIALGLVGLIAYARELNALAAGPEVAASLGVAVERTERAVFALASLLVGVAIALAGPIGFVGLIVPHALRSLLGPDHRLLLPASVVGGGVLLVACDTLARTIVSPAQLPTGAITAVLGGPFFIAILIRQKRRAALWGAP